MKRIAISQRVEPCPDRAEVRDALDQRLVEWVWAAGGIPLLVPNALPPAGLSVWLAEMRPQGVVLSGGNDIGQRPERDATEFALLDYARHQTLPLLGICRGMQMLGHWAGVGLCQVEGHLASRHLLQGAITQEVNSYHAWVLERCPDGFVALAHGPDGCLEAMVHEHLPWQGWMWHPEREPIFAPADVQRWKELLG